MTLSIWITKRKGVRGTRYLVRWIEPDSGANRGKTFHRLQDARMYQAKLSQDLDRGDYVAPVKITYDEWVKRHLEDLRNSPDVDLSPKTIAGHGEALRALRRACRPETPGDIAPKMIRRFRQVQRDGGLTARTVNKHIAAIRSALSYAVRAEILPSNKLLGPHRLFLREEQKEPNALEVGEVVALINAATDLRQRVTISLAYYHGLRRSEICNLQWQDIDFDDGYLSVSDRDGARTKTRRSRTVALRQETAVLLHDLYQDRVNEHVFTHPTAFYWSIDKWFPELVESAKLDKFTLHDLRKTCNTRMIDAGVSQEAAMQVLGHSTPQVNRRHYTGTLVEQQRIAVNSLPSIG